MDRYIVTGAAGFIATNFIHVLAETEPDSSVVAVDYLGFASNPANIDTFGHNVTFEHGDVADGFAMMNLYRKYEPHYVVNFAAESHNDRAIIDPTSFFRSNAVGAQVMLECSRIMPVRAHLHVSTIEVYGELPPTVASFSEASPLNAKTPYSAAKAAGDQIARAYMHTYPSMPIRMTHCANNYGPFQMPEKLIPLMITNVLRGRKVPVYGDGRQMRDWLHVRDHCNAILAVLKADLPPVSAQAAVDPAQLPIFDISARAEEPNIEIVRRVLLELGLCTEDHIEHVPDRPNHDRRYLIDPAKIEHDLGWAPTISLDDGIRETVAWYVENETWWQEILKRTGSLAFSW